VCRGLRVLAACGGVEGVWGSLFVLASSLLALPWGVACHQPSPLVPLQCLSGELLLWHVPVTLPLLVLLGCIFGELPRCSPTLQP